MVGASGGSEAVRTSHLHNLLRGVCSPSLRPIESDLISVLWIESQCSAKRWAAEAPTRTHRARSIAKTAHSIAKKDPANRTSSVPIPLVLLCFLSEGQINCSNAPQNARDFPQLGIFWFSSSLFYSQPRFFRMESERRIWAM